MLALLQNQRVQCHLNFLISVLRRSIQNRARASIHNQMKTLNQQKQFHKVLDLFDRHTENPSADVSSQMIVQVLKACTQMGNLARGMSIHDSISPHLRNNPYVVTSLIHLYMQCGKVDTAESLFRQCSMKDATMYNAMIKGYITQKMFPNAIDLFHRLKSPDEVTTILLLNVCAHLQSNDALNLVKQISTRVPKSSYENPFFLTSLVDALIKCGDIKGAEAVFEQSQTKSQQEYGAMMKGYNKHQMFGKSIDLYQKIREPNEVHVVLLFTACANLETQETLSLVKTVFSQMPQSFYSNAHVLTSLIDALIKCGDIEGAEKVFEQSQTKSPQEYGAMMKGYNKHRMYSNTIEVFKKIREPNEIHVVLLFTACAHLATKDALIMVKKVSSEMSQSLYFNANVLTSLMDALIKCGDIEGAEPIFQQLTRKNQATYGGMMKGYNKNQMFSKTIDVFQEIEEPNEINILLLFSACAHLATKDALNLVKKVSSAMPPSFYSNAHVLTSLIDALIKCGDIEGAEKVFEQSQTKSPQEYGAMMKGYNKHQMYSKTIEVFKKIREPDDVNVLLLFNACANLKTQEALVLVKTVFSQIPYFFHSKTNLVTSLLDALIKCDDFETAETLFREGRHNDLSIVAVMMKGYVKNDHSFAAIQLFKDTKKKGLLLLRDHEKAEKEVIDSNEILYLSVIDALATLGDLSTAESIVKEIPTFFLTRHQVQNVLMHMWGKIGCIDKAEQLFHRIEDPNPIASSIMINAYGLNGRGRQALSLYKQMSPESVDEITHVSVLNACSHSGLIDDARRIFLKISNRTAPITTTMVDCLSRAGLLDEATKMIDQFEETSSPSLTMYMALLSGCRNYKNNHLAEQVYKRMTKHFSETENSMIAAAVLLANTAASAGDLDTASSTRAKLYQSNMKKSIGLSWSIVDSKFYQFRAHDQSHPRSSEIYAEVARILEEISRYGYQPDASWITRPLQADETVLSALSGHSERLAIAWNFVENPNTRRIQIVQNLRICRDCHNATKLIAVVRQCEIIVRDANRIHHFGKDGTCSCNDYF